MTKGLNELVQWFRERPLGEEQHSVLWVDALYEKARYGSRVVSMAIQIVCGVNTQGRREVLALEPMLEESKDTYQQLFDSMKARGLQTPSLVVSDAHKGLIAAIRTSFVGASWQRCKVHFIRNILAHIPHRDKAEFAGKLKEIWLVSSAEEARERVAVLVEKFTGKYSKAVETLEAGVEDSLSFFAFPKLDARRISSTNMLERLNEEIRRQTRIVGIFRIQDHICA